MATASSLVSVEEYLSQTYEPDCDYVDGRLEERNLGEVDHSWLQMAIAAFFHSRRKEWSITVLPEQRVQVKATRYRVPDICVLLGPKPTEQILTSPPFLCIEVLSPEDRMHRVRACIGDYLEMGVPHVWVLDPKSRTAYSATATTGLQEVTGGILRTISPAFEVPLAEMWGEL
jgi:Uma2 family endonuclease